MSTALSRSAVRELLLSTGLTRSEIARKLFVSDAAVDTWLASDNALRIQLPAFPVWELAKIIFNHPHSKYALKDLA